MSKYDLSAEVEEAVFIALQGLRGLGVAVGLEEGQSQYENDKQITRHPVMFAELVHYIHGIAPADDAHIRQQVNGHLSVRRQFNQLLDQISVSSVPAQAQAASGELISERSCRAFTLKFKHSQANIEQVYILLTVHPELGLEDGHAPVLLLRAISDIGRLCFPPIKDRRTQLLVIEGDAALLLARNPEVTLSLT